jgi:hypothetical protein
VRRLGSAQVGRSAPPCVFPRWNTPISAPRWRDAEVAGDLCDASAARAPVALTARRMPHHAGPARRRTTAGNSSRDNAALPDDGKSVEKLAS